MTYCRVLLMSLGSIEMHSYPRAADWIGARERADVRYLSTFRVGVEGTASHSSRSSGSCAMGCGASRASRPPNHGGGAVDSRAQKEAVMGEFLITKIREEAR